MQWSWEWNVHFFNFVIFYFHVNNFDIFQKELEVLTDPMRKEVAMVRKKIDVVNREIKSLGQTCQKKVFSYFLIALLFFIFLYS